jgi:hypothetical protein
MRAIGALLAALVVTSTAGAATVDTAGFRYTRQLAASSGRVLLEPDGPLFAHSRPGFADLRILDAGGRQVPWRRLPPPAEARRDRVPLLNRGRQGGKAVALLDLGPVRHIHDRIELEVPDRDFVASAEVFGSDDRRRFVRLSETQIYDVGGARPARSTTALFPPTDLRYLQVRATGISAITGATVAFDPQQPQLRPADARTSTMQRDRSTTVLLDLGYRNVPVDRIEIASATPRYDRPVSVAASNDGVAFHPAAAGRVTRFATVSLGAVPIATRARYLRVTIANGDDPPLRALAVRPLSAPRTLLLEHGFRAPYRLLYGDRTLRAPRYDFASIPPSELGARAARPGRLGAERENPDFEPPEDTRSFARRHPGVVQAALVLAALAVAGAGVLALRRRA